MTLVVKQNKAPNPVDIGLLSAIRVMLETNCIPDLVKELPGTR
jgi:hypothetical protein